MPLADKSSFAFFSLAECKFVDFLLLLANLLFVAVVLDKRFSRFSDPLKAIIGRVFLACQSVPHKERKDFDELLLRAECYLQPTELPYF